VQPSDVTEGTFLLDVREDDEWAAGHIPGSTHIPMSGLLARVAEVPKDRAVCVVCKVGARSAQVTAYLRQQGWSDVENLEGGVLAWVGAGRPFVAEGGEARVL
jgi:rhodanese-related sulfurtransferase